MPAEFLKLEFSRSPRLRDGLAVQLSTGPGHVRQVVDGDTERFLSGCPYCKEWLPLEERHLNGSDAEDYETRNRLRCAYRRKHEHGRVLISTMQARILIEQTPYDDDYRSLVLRE